MKKNEKNEKKWKISQTQWNCISSMYCLILNKLCSWMTVLLLYDLVFSSYVMSYLKYSLPIEYFVPYVVLYVVLCLILIEGFVPYITFLFFFITCFLHMFPNT